MKTALFVFGLFILAGCAQDETPTEPADRSEPREMPPFPPADNQGRPLYTMADVHARDTQDSCWTAISGEVYDLTEWIEQHPGGARAIVNLCGTDGTAAFEAQHGGNPNPESTLEDYAIGVLG